MGPVIAPVKIDTSFLGTSQWIKFVGAGMQTTVIVTNDDEIYIVGRTLNLKMRSTFEKLNTNALSGDTIVDITVGYMHCMLRTQSGTIYSFGTNVSPKLQPCSS